MPIILRYFSGRTFKPIIYQHSQLLRLHGLDDGSTNNEWMNEWLNEWISRIHAITLTGQNRSTHRKTCPCANRFVHHKYHLYWPGIASDPRGYRPATNQSCDSWLLVLILQNLLWQHYGRARYIHYNFDAISRIWNVCWHITNIATVSELTYISVCLQSPPLLS